MSATATKSEVQSAAVISEIQKYADKIKAGDAPVKPGQPACFTDACTAGDYIAQGDLYITVLDNKTKITDDYEKIENLTEQDKQLVPGQTQGARHCLQHLDGVTMYRPKNWGGDNLAGPILKLSKENTILHPTHGAVTVPAGFTVSCDYQREYDAELRRERRNKD